MQGEYRMFIATPNESLNSSLLTYRRNSHIISVLTFKPAAGMKSTQRPSFDEENISI